MNHIMIDLETFGQTPGCSIMSIGAVMFDPLTSKLGPTLYEVVRRSSCKKAGLVEDPATLVWWEKQSDAAKAALTASSKRSGNVLLEEALTRLSAFVKSANANVQVWGNGSDFDNAILACAYKAVGQKLPWNFWNNRCFRTLKNLSPAEATSTGTPRGVYHNALDDAIYQAHIAIKCLRWIEDKKWAESVKK